MKETPKFHTLLLLINYSHHFPVAHVLPAKSLHKQWVRKTNEQTVQFTKHNTTKGCNDSVLNQSTRLNCHRKVFSYSNRDKSFLQSTRWTREKERKTENSIDKSQECIQLDDPVIFRSLSYCRDIATLAQLPTTERFQQVKHLQKKVKTRSRRE